MRKVAGREIAGRTVRVLEPGVREPASQAPAVVLLNGAGLVSGGWDPVIALLEGWRVITVDRPMSIEAPLPTLDDEVCALEEILETLAHDGLLEAACGGAIHETADDPQGRSVVTKPGGLVIATHSMAAFVAEGLVRRQAGKGASTVGRLVLVDPSLMARKPVASPEAPLLHRGAQEFLRIPGAVGVAQRLMRAGLARQTAGQFHPELWQEAWAGAGPLASGAGQWLSYRRQGRDLWELREAQGEPAPVSAHVLCAPPYPSAGSLRVLHQAFEAVTVQHVPGSRHLMMTDSPATIAAAITGS